MAISHAKVSGKADGADATLVQPSDWNATHVFTGVPRTVVADIVIEVGSGMVVPYSIEIAAGMTLEIGAGAVLEIT